MQADGGSSEPPFYWTHVFASAEAAINIKGGDMSAPLICLNRDYNLNSGVLKYFSPRSGNMHTITP